MRYMRYVVGYIYLLIGPIQVYIDKISYINSKSTISHYFLLTFGVDDSSYVVINTN